MNQSFDIDKNNLKQIVGILGHRLDAIIKLLQPRDIICFASTNKENLSHVQGYLKRIKDKWHGRDQYCLEYDDGWKERRILRGNGEKIYKKFIMIFNHVNMYESKSMAIEVINIYSGCNCTEIKIFGLAIGGKGCTKMQDGEIPKEKRAQSPLILRPYPIFISQQLRIWKSNPRFIPYQI